MSGRCLIIGAGAPVHLPGPWDFSLCADDFVICADGGVDFALQNKIPIGLAVGDFDSSAYSAAEIERMGIPVLRYPSEKDDTDLMIAIREGLNRRYREFAFLCVLGGRLDHTFGNLTALAYLCEYGATGIIYDDRSCVTMLRNGSLTLGPHACKISIFSYTGECRGVSLEGLKYPLSDYTLTQMTPIGVSNEFKKGLARISVREGKLLVMLCLEN